MWTYRSYIYLMGFLGIIGIYTCLYFFVTEREYQSYRDIRSLEYLQTGTYADPKITRIASMGHDVIYADTTWIGFIQYIGANLGRWHHLDFSHKTLQYITDLAPHFASAYEWGLLLLPVPSQGGAVYTDAERALLQIPRDNALKSMQIFCDPIKLNALKNHPLNAHLWKTKSLRNPCKYGNIPYYLAFYGGELAADPLIARTYYTIAGMQDDVPTIAQILAILAHTPADNARARSQTFALLAYGWYDNPPYQCHALTQELLTFLHSHTPYTAEWIRQIHQKEAALIPSTNPHIQGAKSCYAMWERAIKYLYIDYITQVTKNMPHIHTMQDVIDAGIIDIPLTLQIQPDMQLTRTSEEWIFRTPPTET